MDTVQLLNIILIVVLFIIAVLGGVAIIIIVRIKSSKNDAKKQQIQQQEPETKNRENLITRSGETINSIYEFMEFDYITDNMIVRKNGNHHVMVIECKGINYDLLSEDEKNAVESGFIAMLNTLRFPIQLYIQTRTLNLRALVNKYVERTDEIKDQIFKTDTRIQAALNNGDEESARALQREKSRKQNIFEYGKSIEDYTMRISGSRNILQQKTYIVVSYFPSEYGDLSKYSKEEINDIAFSELYTRCQTLIRALASAEVNGKVLSSEELAELLYVAYNRDESEKYTLKDALNAEYDRLYSTARDVLEEKKRRLEMKIEQDAQKVATKSIVKADEITRQERIKRIKARAKEMVEDYKGELSKPLYEETKRQIDQADVDEMLKEKTQSRRVVRRQSNN
ncbi:MAG: hypothetical protein IKG56_04420 [Clostridia bacterium]|nr:hypothetical protein [Clostridia bacterium]